MNASVFPEALILSWEACKVEIQDAERWYLFVRRIVLPDYNYLYPIKQIESLIELVYVYV